MNLESRIGGVWDSFKHSEPFSGPRDDLLRRIAVSAFFVCLLLVGLCSYRDYGLAWDEPQQRTIGQVTLKYVAEKFAPSFTTLSKGQLPELHEFIDKDYGVGFEALEVALEVVFKLHDKHDVYQFRHLLVFLACFGGVFAVYGTAARRFMDWRIGLLAALFMVLSPRIFADFFYNSKDAVFMAAFAIATYTTISFIRKPNIRTALLHALATAFAMDVRIMAIVLIVPAVVFPAIRGLRGELDLRRVGWAVAAYLGALCLFVLASWPYLWSDPLGNFAAALKDMSHFRWGGEVLYMGRFIPATQLPWHYPLVWIAVTTPLLYLAPFGVGLYGSLRQIVARRFRLWEGDAEMQDVIFVALSVAPVAAVIVLQSVLYDGWRHLYFVYPAFLLLAVKGWVTLWTAPSARNLAKPALAALTSVSAVCTAVWMWNAHPLENVYFNSLAGRNLSQRFDMDYWGLGNRMALDYVLKNDQSPVIHVWSNRTNPVDFTFLILKPEDRARLVYSNDRTKPLYFVTNYRNVHSTDYREYRRQSDLVYQIKRNGEAILSVYKPKFSASNN